MTALDRVLSVVHWAWFFEPHLALLDRPGAATRSASPRAARQMAATYDLGCAIYFAVPTAPPWWAAEQGYIERRSSASRPSVAGAEAPHVRRIMVEVGEEVWGRAWPPLYDSLGGNPWAAMPSLHFATSLMAAMLLSEIGPLAGRRRLGVRAARSGFALVYLGEHYVTDLLAGAALVALVRRGEPLAEPPCEAVNRVAAAPRARSRRNATCRACEDRRWMPRGNASGGGRGRSATRRSR